jgi:hypothetical protein
MSNKLPAGIALVAVILFGTPTASSASAVCDQYPDLPQCTMPATGSGGDSAGEPGGDDAATGASAGIPGGSGPGGGSAEPGKAGELPFTGYPVSPLAAVILALLGAGIAIRSYLALRHRFAPSTPRS